ncbi:hypothetical protein F441_14898 [Phytophthora nicotianae CJ01A1]|uniref:Uncharacterized protein n=2 Tax=Phytophthora nicotianae TaxID=4792 RepID=W2WFH8_PHYNI|nr:hypothetical protein L915_14646 [Phytophthora nicotianae]ETP09226.1 hypothetical protein F441_14898 [Phytophthora nicotianae CJ01A1]
MHEDAPQLRLLERLCGYGTYGLSQKTMNTTSKAF